MNMNWRKNQNTVQKRGIFSEMLNVISDVIGDDDTSCSNGANSSGANSSGATNGNGFFGGTSNGGAGGAGGAGAGPLNTDELTITINAGNAIPFTQELDSVSVSDSGPGFIHIMESNIEDKGYQARFGILTPVPSVNANDYSLTLYDNNRNVIVHADKISDNSESFYGYQIITTKKTDTKTDTSFIVYKTETCSITVSGIQSS